MKNQGMKMSNLLIAGLVASAILAAFLYGVIAQKNGLFPLKQLVQIKKMMQGARAEDELVKVPFIVTRTSLFEAFPRAVDVVMVGDSLTGYVEWADLFPGVSIANRGINGDTTYGLLRRISTVTATQAKTALICIGLNDFTAGREVEAVYNDYVAAVEVMIAAGMKVHVLSTVLSRSPASNDKIQLLNARLSGYTASKGLTFTDLNAVLSQDGMLRQEYTYDGTHLRAPAYRAWREAIAPLMDPL